MIASAPVHTLTDYLNQAMPVLLEIPGMAELLSAKGAAYEAAVKKYPDAVFALMTMNNLFHHDWEFSQIHQQAFCALVEGEAPASVRRRYNRRMDAYWEKHLWDD